MLNKTIYYFLFLYFITSSLVSYGNKIELPNNAKQRTTPNAIDGFLENKGQMTDMDGSPVDFVLFKIEVPGLDFYITETGATYLFKKLRKEAIPENELTEYDKEEEKMSGKKKTNKVVDWERIDLILKGASIKKENVVTEYASKQGHLNFFYPHCPDGIYGVKEYGKITIKEVYPNIDWVFYNSSNSGYKYDFVVHSGANPADIQLIYRAKEQLALSKTGEITIKTKYGNLVEEAPKSYLNDKLVASSFNLASITKNDLGGFDNLITFTIAAEVKNQLQKEGNTLVIDPQLVWSTFYGGSGHDELRSITTDNNGNVFITGFVVSTNFPVQDAGTFFQVANAGGSFGTDMVILKFDNSGVRLWATYYGGYGSEYGNSITTDDNGNVFITGSTGATNFPLQDAGTFFQATNGGGLDMFILKFDNLGNRLWGTYYGGSDRDFGNSITTDNNGNVLITGATSSTNFPLQDAGTFFQATHGGSGPFNENVFILKFDNLGNRLWATYYGGNSGDYGASITTDNNGNIFITGGTLSTNFPVQDAGTFFQGTKAGVNSLIFDAFVLKFDNLGNRLWATYYGGSQNDSGSAITTDNNGNVFITGYTYSTNFPVQNAGTFFQATNGGGLDMFILKFDNFGNRLWATYYGGSNSDSKGSISIDNCGDVYVVLGTSSNDISTLPFCGNNSYFQNTLKGISDQFLIKFNNTGVLLGATYVGGDGGDYIPSITVDRLNNLWMRGVSDNVISGASYPLVNPGGGTYFDNSLNGSYDAFIAKFSNQTGKNIDTLSTPASCIVCDGSATVSVTGLCAPYDYIWANGIETLAVTDTFNTITNLCAGIYPVMVIAACDTLRDTVIVGGDGATPNVLITPVNPTIISGESIDLTASGAVSYLWGDGSTNNLLTVSPNQATTEYCVVGTSNNNCKDTTCVTVIVEGDVILFIPNVFTPNGDGINDVLQFFNTDKIAVFNLQIFNRWGTKIYESFDAGKHWDGGDQNAGTYFYILTYTIKPNGENKEIEGSVTLFK